MSDGFAVVMEDQMTHFPALAPETDHDNSDGRIAKNSQSNGIINSIFGNIFRGYSMAATSVETRQQTEVPGLSEASQENDNRMAGYPVTSLSIVSTNFNDPREIEVDASVGTSNSNQMVGPTTNGDLKNYKQSEFRRYWMPDATGRECYECHEKFNAFRRRHHCRLCGQIFCGRCSSRQINGAELGYSGVLRLCSYCANQVESHVNEQRRKSIYRPMELPHVNHSQTNTLKERGELDLSSPFLENVLRKATGEFSNSNELPVYCPEQVIPSTSSNSSTDENTPIAEKCDVLARRFDENIEKMLDDVMWREHLNSKLWKNLLLTLSTTIVENVYSQVLRIPNALNLLDFVHIKKIPSTSKPDFEMVHGVAFSKTLAHQLMPTSIANASIMLLAGNISYERVVEKLSSLEQIMLQEKEYIKTQVERVTSRRISLLFVEHSVSQLAIEMLLNAGVSAAVNVRHKVLERVARATNSDIISSLDAQFLQPRIGFTPGFIQRQFTLTNGKRKTVLILDQCSGGLSVLLYGKSTEELIAAKRVLKLLLLLRYSSKLELEFIRMFDAVPYANPSIYKCNIKKTASHLEGRLNVMSNDQTKYRCECCELNQISEALNDPEPSKFVRLLRYTQLTNSPAIRFAPPFFETNAGKDSQILPYFRRPLFHFLEEANVERLNKADEDERYHANQALIAFEEDKRDNEKLYHSMFDDEMTDPNIVVSGSRWSSFRVQSWFPFRRRYELNQLCDAKRAENLKNINTRRLSTESKRRTDLLNAYNCQRIPFLYCANSKKVSSNARTFCMGPYVLLRQFYQGLEIGHKDTSLGVFLMNYCFNNEYKCGSCDRSMLDHLRRIVHRNARIEIAMHSLPKSNASAASASFTGTSDDIYPEGLPSSIPNMNCSLIVCWRRCPKCGANSCSIPLPNAVYHMSFAKFIDYLANGTHWISAFPTGNFGEVCKHCTFHQHIHYFAYHNFLASFRVCSIRPLHVSFNSIICRIEPKDMLCRDLIEAHYDLNSSASDAFDSAISFFKDVQQSTSCRLTTASESLLEFVEQIKATFRVQMGDFDPDGIFKRSKAISSTDPYYGQSESCLIRCRYLLYAFITKWNSSKLDGIFVAPTCFTNASRESVVDDERSSSHLKTRNDSSGKLNVNDRNDSSKNLLKDYNGGKLSRNIELLEVSSSKNSALVNLNSTYLTEMMATPLEYNFSIKDKSSHSRQNSFGTSSHFHKNSRNPSRSNVAVIENGNVAILEDSQNPQPISLPSELPEIVSNLPKNLHFELPSNDFVIRDLIDGKVPTNDVASIIAYTLSTPEYQERKRHTARKCDSNDTTYWEFSCGSEAKTKYSVKVYFAEEFESFRSKLIGDGEATFIRSLSRSTAWHPQGGKSGANFFRTEDERFVIKQMLRLELESFKKFGYSYLDYIKKAHNEQKLTSLCKIYGVFGINVTGKAQPNFKIDVLVMEYLFYGKNVKQVWDLKGSLRNRYASTKTETAVLLDENLVEDLWGNQLYVDQYSKLALSQAITNDSTFLKEQGIMDYSLLAGVCQDEVVIGIVDYVRTFTLDKKVESLVKNALPMAHTPTVLNPDLYCKRFYEAIDGYFAVAPDQWTTTSAPNTAALLQHGEDEKT